MQSLDPGTAVILILTDEDILRLTRLARLGLERADRAARVNGGATPGDGALIERLEHVARQARGRLKARSNAGRATPLADDDTASASSAMSWLTTADAARLYGVDPSHLRRKASQGALRARLGAKGEWRLDPDGLAEWAARRGNATRPPREAA